MNGHLRFSGQSAEIQEHALRQIIGGDQLLMAVLAGIRDEGLPEGWLVSGAIYNTAWNLLTNRPARNGLNDIDIAYFDDTDLSYEAEDAVIRRMDAALPDVPVPLQVRNQARVHLWFESRFGVRVDPLHGVPEALRRYASIAHAVGARIDEAGRIHILAPFGLDDLFSFRLRPNRVLDNSRTHNGKAARALALWPELSVELW